MPEGPEIRRAADRLALVLDNATIHAAVLNHSALSAHSRDIVGALVNRVYCRGKAMLIEFSTGVTVYSHNQLYGLWQIDQLGSPNPSNRQLRLELCVGKHAVRLFSATDISVWDTDQIHQHPYLLKLGPDVLEDSVSPVDIFHRLDEKAYRRRSLAALYLDQGYAAGIGNYLRSEILFTARCHPDLRPVDLDAPQRRQLAKETLRLSRLSYRTGGVTNQVSRAKKLKREGSSFEAYRFYVFERDGAACYECQSLVVREQRASRRIYWCPNCQSL